ncbi:MAG: transketolase [Deltaproteobacteria bacterium]|nr:transketolase [Deltaproteobacteria bacterium]
MSTQTPGQRAAHTIRGLAMDAVQQANSGHPGAPMGMADMATVLWTEHLKVDPADPRWPDRDRVVLSNGHASMLLYSVLFLSGAALTLDDLKRFRQWGSPTAGHPEHHEVPGVETTTGPLGQGFANAVGMAMAERRLREELGAELVDHHTWVFVGDGCLMEGISYEAAALAGHLGLGKLIALFDDNGITIDGRTDIATSEDTTLRFEAAGWTVLSVDGHDHEQLSAAMAEAKAAGARAGRPTLIRCRTTIAFGAPTLGGTSKSHGSPLGAAEIAATKRALGLDPERHFDVPDDVLAFFRAKNPARAAARAAWSARLEVSPARARFDALHGDLPLSTVAWPSFEPGKPVATRKAGQMALNAAAKALPGLVGGSADLAGSNGSTINGEPAWSRSSFAGRNIHFGIREHAMAAICNGLALHGGLRPYCATFLVFYDYLRPAVRLAALMHLPVIYVLTHDSVHVGEDGPTHQPIEHLWAMRGVPNLHVLRPADAAETAEAWRYALARTDGPTVLALSRQDLPVYDRARLGDPAGLHQGAYTLREAATGTPDVVLIGTGSEVEVALDAALKLEAEGIFARVVSMPSVERFRSLPRAAQAAVLPPGVPRVSVEAGITLGWQAIVGLDGASVGIDRFGASAPGVVVAEQLGLTPQAVAAAARSVLRPV